MASALQTNQIEEHLSKLSGWTLTQNGKRIRKDWQVSNFLAGLESVSYTHLTLPTKA